MIYKDPLIRRHVERVTAIMTGLPKDQDIICGLMDAYGWYALIEGKNSPRVTEALELLLSPELRPALRKWYSKDGSKLNPGATEVRDLLSQLSGETFG